MNATQTMPQQSAVSRELTALDRCDSCGAKAWVRAVFGDTELLFCAHHASTHIEALVESGAYVQDDRTQLWEEEEL